MSSRVEVDDSVLPGLVVTIEQLLCPLAPPHGRHLSNANAKQMVALKVWDYVDTLGMHPE